MRAGLVSCSGSSEPLLGGAGQGLCWRRSCGSGRAKSTGVFNSSFVHPCPTALSSTACMSTAKIAPVCFICTSKLFLELMITYVDTVINKVRIRYSYLTSISGQSTCTPIKSEQHYMHGLNLSIQLNLPTKDTSILKDNTECTTMCPILRGFTVFKNIKVHTLVQFCWSIVWTPNPLSK